MFDKLKDKLNHHKNGDGGAASGSNEPCGILPRPQGKVVVGYFANWDIYERKFKVNDIPAQYLTHILYAFANIKPSGEVFLTDEWADAQIKQDGDPDGEYPQQLMGNLGELYRLKQQYRHLKVLLSIGGWSFSSSFKKPASSSSGRQTFAASCVQILEDYGFDGIDLDWEYPSNDSEAKDYVSLLREIRGALDAHAAQKGINPENGYELTIAAPAGSESYGPLRVREMDAYLSWWNLMAYDYAGSWDDQAYHQAALFDADPSKSSSDRALQFYSSNGVTADKLVLGIPLYGRSFMNTQGPNTSFNGVGKGSYEKGVYDYKDLPIEGGQIDEDLNMCAGWCNNPQTGEWVSFDTPRVGQAKANFVNKNNLGGIMFWELSGDRKDEYALVPIMSHAIAPLDSRENHLEYSQSRFENIRG